MPNAIRIYKQGGPEVMRWESVDLPHTWNTHDPFDERPGYYRGIGWYAYQLNITKPTTPKNYILHFEAVNQEAEVMLNGKTVGKHLGGYTAFSIDITKQLSNLIRVILKTVPYNQRSADMRTAFLSETPIMFYREKPSFSDVY